METSNVFNTPPPEFNQEEVLDILLKYYNIDCSIENLVSDRDQNFKIISKEQIYILKIANSAESKRVLEMQNLAMNYICLLYTSPSPRDATLSRMASSA